MMPNYSSEIWPTLGTALGNHLWQSTLFAIAAGLLTLALRKNHAQARYWLWLAASVKFLIPFSLLVALGSHLAWTHGATGANTGVYVAMEEFTQPFATTTLLPVAPATPQTNYASMVHLLPTLLGVVWFCGFLAVSLVGYLRWRRVSASIRRSVPLREGREVEVLRRLESSGGIRKPIPLLLSAGSLEPGIFGIARPVLVWPEGISERLENAHLQAILAHEICHVRRRDNLAAAVHMLVEAIFWFHPLVWWMGARLVEERERACDEEVLEAGTQRQVYAESILKICEFCVGSPLACVSGVTGADLKKRIARIMTESLGRKLDFTRKLLLSAAGLLAVALPLTFGLMNATQSRAESQAQNSATPASGFESSSIKPSDPSGPAGNFMFGTDSFTGTKITLQMLIRSAYGVEDAQISGGPSWLNSEKYDIDAKMGQATVQKLQKLGDGERFAEWRRMVQALLEERFKLTVHRETKGVPGYALVITKNGSRLHESKPGDTYPNGIKGPDGQLAGAGTMHQGVGELTVQGLPMRLVAHLLSEQLGREIVDETGLAGTYDFALNWTPDESQPPMFRGMAQGQPGAGNAFAPTHSGPSIYAAIQEQLGLKLEPQNVPLEVLVIDHAEKPVEK